VPTLQSPKQTSQNLAPWERPEAFNKKPEGYGPYGWVNAKGEPQGFQSFYDLSKSIEADSSDSGSMIWTPDSNYFIMPEECPELFESVKKFHLKAEQNHFIDAKRNCLIYGIIFLLLLAFFPPQLQASNQILAFSFILLTINGIHPLFNAFKSQRSIQKLDKTGMHELAQKARFETWVNEGKNLQAKILIGIITLTSGFVFLQPELSLQEAGAITKPFHGLEQNQWLTLFTAPLLHGNLLHLFMNTTAILYLGKRTESLMRWTHVIPIFLISALTGSLATAYTPLGSASIGASGGAMGLLGALLTFEIAHPRLSPRSAIRTLTSFIAMTFVIGLIGFTFIDNAAHLGGLIGGAMYAFLVFPKSNSTIRPQTSLTSQITFYLSLLIIIISALNILF